MYNLKLSTVSLHVKLFLTSLICIIGLIYLSLVMQKWIDTGEWPFMVAEGYQYMEYIELTDYAHFNMPYYAIFIFTIPITLFMFTSFGEKTKVFFAVVPFLVIALDTASIFLIPYVWLGFALLLWFTGTFLGLTLLTLFILTLYDMWFRKVSVA